MSAPTTEPKPPVTAGWIFFDAECAFCTGSRRRWGGVFERRGFVWLPLQTPGTAARLKVTESQLWQGMWLQRSGGPAVCGLDAWIVLMRSVGWLRPLGWLLTLPGFNALGHRAYRFLARHRHCLGGACKVQRPVDRPGTS